jgi:hypothetical protein
VVDARTSVALNLVPAGGVITLVVELTWTSYTKSPAVIGVLAVPGDDPKVTGLEQDEADNPADATENPLSMATRPFATFRTEPISA